MLNTYKTEIKWALLFVVAVLAWMIVEKSAGLHDTHIDKHALYTNLFAIPAIAIYILALREKRDSDYGGVMTYKQGFISGLIITLIVTVLSPLTQFISSTIITPGYFANMIDYAVEQGALTREVAESHFSMRSYIIQGLIGAPVMGILTTAIVAFFVKKKGS